MNIMDAIKTYKSFKDFLDELIYTTGYVDIDDNQRVEIQGYLKGFNSFDDGIKYLEDKVRVIGSYNELTPKIEKFIKRINEFISKTNIHSFNEFGSRIKELWDENHFYDVDLIRIVLCYPEDYNLGDIYIDMVNESLIENVNKAIGTSSEPIFTMLPNDERYYESNLKLLSSPEVDWKVLRNGTTALEYYIFSYNHATNDTAKKYFHDVIMNAMKSSLCIFNSQFYHHKGCTSIPRVPNIDHLGLYPLDRSFIISDPDFIEEIRNYLLTSDGINHQESIYTDKCEYCDKIIEDFKNEIKRTGNCISKTNRLE